jgi:hypothetical protein
MVGEHALALVEVLGGGFISGGDVGDEVQNCRTFTLRNESMYQMINTDDHQLMDPKSAR